MRALFCCVILALFGPVLPAGAGDWSRDFADVSRGAIVVDTAARTLTWWPAGGGTARTVPVAVARAPELERRGRTRVVRKQTDPAWAPTPSMRAADPTLPVWVAPGPANPMGEHALYLGWTHFAIHGTNDPLSVGRATSSGCFRLHPEDVLRLYREVPVGAPVVVR